MKGSVTLPELRKAHKMSQRDLAKALDVTPGAVALWELGERVPRVEMARAIAQLFGLESSDVITFPGIERRNAHSSQATNTA